MKNSNDNEYNNIINKKIVNGIIFYQITEKKI